VASDWPTGDAAAKLLTKDEARLIAAIARATNVPLEDGSSPRFNVGNK